jgi:hypothetical protein
MSDMNCRVKRVGLRVAFLWGILGLTTLLPVTLWAGRHIVQVQPPNGTDDTANIQAALDACVMHGPPCTVQLAAGTYVTRQLLAFNFQGTFKGMSTTLTTIEAFYPLPVKMPDVSLGECMPNLTTCLWPTLIDFVDGDIHVSDLSIKETAPPGKATTGWYWAGTKFTDLLEPLRFMGQNPTYATIDRIAIEGLPDDSSTSFGFNVINGVIYTGELPRSSAPFDYYFLSGTYTVRNSSFKSTYDGVSQDGFLKDTSVTVGGSPSTGNVFENVYVGMDMESSENSTFEVSYNTSSGISDSMWVVPWLPAFVPSTPSLYFIHDNTFTTTGAGATGIYLWSVAGANNAENPWISAMIYNNTIEPEQGSTILDGIGAYNTIGAAIWNNTIRGSGKDAIRLGGSNTGVIDPPGNPQGAFLCTVIDNDVSGFTANPNGLFSVGYAQIYLDPTTSNNLVACSNNTNTVLDQGTMNTEMSCHASTTSAASTTSVAPQDLPRRKPLRR